MEPATAATAYEELGAEVRAALRVRAELPPAGERQRIRKQARVPLRRVAAAIGVSAQTVLRWENGADPRLDHAAEYGRVLAELRAAVA